MSTLAIAVTALLFVIGFASAARRLLGVPVGLVRALLAGALGMLVASPLSRAMVESTGDPQAAASGWFALLAVTCSLLSAMVFLVVAEALLPSGSLGHPFGLRRTLRRKVGRIQRCLQVFRILARHGLVPYLRGRRRRLDTARARVGLGQSLRGALDEAGVTYVKLGQVLATRRDLIPEEVADELSRLHDDAAPVPWPDVEAVLTSSLGGSVEELFAYVDEVPLASASVAQVHAARLHSGEDVVIKVQRPGIRRLVARDLDIAFRLAEWVGRRTRWGATIGVHELAEGFAQAIREELDFRVEAGNMSAVAASSASRGADGVHVPVPYLALCTDEVIVMERLAGTPVGAAHAVIARAGWDRQALAATLLDSLLQQVLVDGVFHADPHPGNVLLLDDGRLGLLDYGSVGRLDAGLRGSLQRLLAAMDRGDPMILSDALQEVVTSPEAVDQQRLERSLGQFTARHLGPGGSPSVRMFTDLFRIVAEHRLSVPPEVAAVFRSFATLEGTLARLAPGFDTVQEARSLASGFAVRQLDPRATPVAAAAEFAQLLPILRRLPRRIERIASTVEHGRLTANVRLFADERDRRYATDLVHQVVLAFLGATIGLMAVLLLGTDGGPAVTPTVSLYQLLSYNLLVVGAVLVLRVLVLTFRRDR